APYFTCIRCAWTLGSAPIRSSSGTFQGRSDSPMWNRGNFSRSKTATRRPARARVVAKVDPAGPPPQTIASRSFRIVGSGVFDALGERVVMAVMVLRGRPLTRVRGLHYPR